jgi:hypothetical protein
MIRGFCCSMLLLLLMAAAARAEELVVVEAHGLPLAPGATIDGAKVLTLEDGQAVTLLAASGQVLKLEGPYAAAPGSGGAGGGTDLRVAIAALASQRSARTSEIGVIRGGSEVALPDPWVVDVSHPGTSCVEHGRPVVLWREAPLAETRVIFSPKDLSWTEAGAWPAASDRLSLPANMPLRDRTDYVVDLDGKLAPVTIRLIPDSVSNDAMRIGYMNELGCGDQANALLAAYRK